MDGNTLVDKGNDFFILLWRPIDLGLKRSLEATIEFIGDWSTSPYMSLWV